MGDDDSKGEPDETFHGIERDIWIEEQVDQLWDDFFRAVDAGQHERARELVERFEASLDRLPPELRHEVISETTVMLGDELKARREAGGNANDSEF